MADALSCRKSYTILEEELTMKSNKSSLILGLVFIAIGGLAFAAEMGYLDQLSTTTWMVIFAAASLLFFVAYFLKGLHAWSWLFPACIFAGLAGVTLLANSNAAEWVPTLVIGSTAIPFFVAFALDHTRKWALIPGCLLGLIAFIFPLGNFLGEDAMGVMVIAVIAFPFIAASILSPDAWWGVIPGGILLSVALMIVVGNFLAEGMAVVAMFLGWMLTFGFVWLWQSRPWARVATIVMSVLTIIMFLVAMGLGNYWAIGLVVAGLVLVVLSLLPRRTPAFK
jgi:hypothetical protein